MRRDEGIYLSTVLRRLLGAILGVVLFLGGPTVQEANAWWDGNWKLRKKIQFDTSSTGADIKENLTDVTVLIGLHTGNFNFASAKPDGSDLRFISADDKTPLKYHIEKFDSSEEIAFVWVKVPMISGGGNQDFIWLYYGNPKVPDGQDVGGTYDQNQVAVYHFRELEGPPKDATTNANHAVSFTGKINPAALIGNGIQFSKPEERMTIAKSPSLNFSKGFTFSAWIRVSRPAKDGRILFWDDGTQSFLIGLDEAKVYCSLNPGKGQAVVTPKTATLTPNRWRHLTVTVDPGKRITLYLDGKEATSSELKGSIPEPYAEIIIGAPAKGGNGFSGDLDEIQLSNTARPAEWIRAAFHSQGPEGSLVSVSLEEEAGGGSGESETLRLIQVIIRNISMGGWVLIGALTIIGSACFVVFVEKIISLRKVRNGNEKFSMKLRHHDQPLSHLEKDQDLQDSSFYRIYRAGYEELKIWLEKDGKSLKDGGRLSDRALNGFKSALDKAFIQESRRLSGGMFILNVGVAGGPFMGLLGTVWGVMTTFAGLAEAAEVNLQVIAPGVGSALACTLVGLLVAIPSLFASIYLTGQIKHINADMNVFVEEIILKIEDAGGNVQ